jgi:hypothetical protein
MTAATAAAAAAPASTPPTPSAAASATAAEATAAGAAAAAEAELASVTDLIHHLQSYRGQRLWPREAFRLSSGTAAVLAAGGGGQLLPSSAALGSLVSSVVEVLSYEHGLAEEWSQRALDWALHARSRHVSCRSWQVGAVLYSRRLSERQ